MFFVYGFAYGIFFSFLFAINIYAQENQNPTTSSASTSTTNLSKLNLPFNLELSEKEKKYINSLSKEEFARFKKVIEMVLEKKLDSLIKNSGFGNMGRSTTTTPTTYSNTPSPQTPYYNPQTGQYQSTPPTPGGSGGSPSSPASSISSSPMSGSPSSGSSGSESSPGNGNFSGGGSPSKCAGKNMSHQEAIQKLNSAGISTPNTRTSFEGLPEGTVLMARKIKEECKCNIVITSATRKWGSSAKARPEGHHPGNMVVDFAYNDPRLNSYIRAKGGNSCRPAFKGIRFIDEGKCPIAGVSQGAHWHVDARNWDCT